MRPGFYLGLGGMVRISEGFGMRLDIYEQVIFFNGHAESGVTFSVGLGSIPKSKSAEPEG